MRWWWGRKWGWYVNYRLSLRRSFLPFARFYLTLSLSLGPKQQESVYIVESTCNSREPNHWRPTTWWETLPFFILCISLSQTAPYYTSTTTTTKRVLQWLAAAAAAAIALDHDYTYACVSFVMLYLLYVCMYNTTSTTQGSSAKNFLYYTHLIAWKHSSSSCCVTGSSLRGVESRDNYIRSCSFIFYFKEYMLLTLNNPTDKSLCKRC